MLHHVLAVADNPLGYPVLDVLVCIVAVLLEDADPEQVVNHLLRLVDGHAVHSGQLRRRVPCPKLLEGQHELCFFLRQHAVEDPEVHVVFVHAARHLSRNIVRAHAGQLHDNLALFGIVAVVVFEREIPFVYVNVRIDFTRHSLFPLFES